MLPDLSKLKIDEDAPASVFYNDLRARTDIRALVEHVRQLSEENEKLQKRVVSLEGEKRSWPIALSSYV